MGCAIAVCETLDAVAVAAREIAAMAVQNRAAQITEKVLVLAFRGLVWFCALSEQLDSVQLKLPTMTTTSTI
jgi:alpha-D-ribose 1-methylphosphonate 5-triphosphate synthase subunit PhnI